MNAKQLLSIAILMAISIESFAGPAPTIPTQFQGVWGDDKAACSQLKKGLNTDKITTIKSDQLIGYESKCNLQSGEMKGSSFEGKFSCEDADGKYKSSYILGTNAQHQLSSSVTTNGKKLPATMMVSCGEQSASAIAEISKPNAAAPDAPGKGSVTGSYKYYENDLTVQQLSSGRIKFKISAMAGTNVGEASGEITLAGDTAVYKNNDYGKCVITFKFIANKAILAQDGQCGMGNNVSADGTYKKFNGKMPNFLEGAEVTKAPSKTHVRVSETQRSAPPNTSIGKSQAPVVSCSAEDQVGMIDPRTGQMSQRALDIQMGRVRCR